MHIYYSIHPNRFLTLLRGMEFEKNKEKCESRWKLVRLTNFSKKKKLFKNMLRNKLDIPQRNVLRNGWEGVYII